MISQSTEHKYISQLKKNQQSHARDTINDLVPVTISTKSIYSFHEVASTWLYPYSTPSNNVSPFGVNYISWLCLLILLLHFVFVFPFILESMSAVKVAYKCKLYTEDRPIIIHGWNLTIASSTPSSQRHPLPNRGYVHSISVLKYLNKSCCLLICYRKKQENIRGCKRPGLKQPADDRFFCESFP